MKREPDDILNPKPSQCEPGQGLRAIFTRGTEPISSENFVRNEILNKYPI